jgi:hypothetical protein
MEEATGGQVNCRLPSGLSQGLKGKWWDKSTSLFPELILEELVFLCHAYYSIFLLEQEPCAPYEIQL